jgi:hypothetical protein
MAMKKQMMGVLALSLLSACGGGPTNPPPPPPPEKPAASITASGAGDLVLHPSANPAYAIAMETPIRITETAGGTASWSYARMSLKLGGAEIERTEIGASDLRASGVGPIAARSDTVYNLIFRFNSSEFDEVDITLGFRDSKESRQFTAAIPVQSFDEVLLNFTPLSLQWSKLPM